MASEYYLTNHQGSVVATASTTNGQRINTYTYDAYGNIGNGEDASQPFRYTGRRYDAETGLYYYRARYYSSTLGRFMQTDPIGYEDNMNMYGYVGNDPVNGTDPSGKAGIFTDFLDQAVAYYNSLITSTFANGNSGPTDVRSNSDQQLATAAVTVMAGAQADAFIDQVVTDTAGGALGKLAEVGAGALKVSATAVKITNSTATVTNVTRVTSTQTSRVAVTAGTTNRSAVSIRPQATVNGQSLPTSSLPSNATNTTGIAAPSKQLPTTTAVNPGNTTMGSVQRGFKVVKDLLDYLGEGAG